MCALYVGSTWIPCWRSWSWRWQWSFPRFQFYLDRVFACPFFWLPFHGLCRASTERPLHALRQYCDMLASTIANDAACLLAVKCAGEVSSHALALSECALHIFSQQGLANYHLLLLQGQGTRSVMACWYCRVLVRSIRRAGNVVNNIWDGKKKKHLLEQPLPRPFPCSCTYGYFV